MSMSTKYDKTKILITNKNTDEGLQVGNFVTKIIKDEYIDETIVLIKYLYNQGECKDLFTLGNNFSIVTQTDLYDIDNNYKKLEPRQEEIKCITLVRKYKSLRTEIDTDDILVFSTSGNNSEKVDRLIEREEKEQLNNTIYKIKTPIFRIDKYDSEKFLDKLFKKVKEITNKQ